MTVDQKAAVLATLEIYLDNIRRLLEWETDPEWRRMLSRAWESLSVAYAAIAAIKTVG